MQTGDLVLFRGRGPIAWLIRAWTRSAWDHCGVLWLVEGVPLVLEARYVQGVSCHALANRLEDRPDLYHTGRSVDLAFALKHLGDWYSIKDAIRAGLGEEADHAGYECAEFAAAVFGLKPNRHGWTPQNLADFLL